MIQLPPKHIGVPPRGQGAWAIHYAPAASLPRLRDLFFTQLPPEAVVLFCLRSDGISDPRVAGQLLHASLKQLKQTRLREIFALACPQEGAPQGERCEFFSRVFLDANGFEELQSCGEVFLMRADLRGLLSVLSPLENSLRRLFHHDPTPSPAAWSSSSRGPS